MPESPARTALADDHAHDRRRQPGHLQDARRDELRLPALLGPDPGEGPRRVDQADDRHPELGRQPHLVQGLPVPLGVGAAVIARLPLLERVALLVADQQHLEVRRAGRTRTGSPGRPRTPGRRAVRRTRRRSTPRNPSSAAAPGAGPPGPSPTGPGSRTSSASRAFNSRRMRFVASSVRLGRGSSRASWSSRAWISVSNGSGVGIRGPSRKAGLTSSRPRPPGRGRS